MAAKDAADLGVQTGDTVEVSSSEHTGQVEVRVTQRLKPGVVFLPTHYGGDAPAQTRAYHYGISLTDFIPLDAEPGVGSMMSQEVAVTVKKMCIRDSASTAWSARGSRCRMRPSWASPTAI